MTLGEFLPAVMALVALLELLVFRNLRARIPGRTERGYNEQHTEQRRFAFSLVMLASILTPVLLYVVLNFITPEIGAIEIF